MRQWFTKLVCLALLAAFAAFSAIGCSSASDKEDEAFNNEINAIYKNLQPVTLTFYFPGSEPSDWKTVKAALENKLAKTVNARLDFKWLAQDLYFNSIGNLTASADSFDAFTCGEPDRNTIENV